jgi:hypothetical protein
MPRSFGVVFVLALAIWALFGILVGQALGNHVGCGGVITQDTDLVDCTGDGIVIGAGRVALVRGDKVTKMVLYYDRGCAFADLGLSE